MGRMVKCAFTGKIADSSCLYKVGRQWFEDKDTYIRYLKSKDISSPLLVLKVKPPGLT